MTAIKNNDDVDHPEPECPSNQQMQVMLEDLQAEFEAFRESSAELERELETELERIETRARMAEIALHEERESHSEVTQSLKKQVGDNNMLR